MPKSIEEFEKLRKQPKSVETFEAIRTGSSFSVSDPIFKKQPKKEPSLWENVKRNWQEINRGIETLSGSIAQEFPRGGLLFGSQEAGKPPPEKGTYPPIGDIAKETPRAISEHYAGYIPRMHFAGGMAVAPDPQSFLKAGKKIYENPVDALLDALLVGGVGKSVATIAGKFKAPKIPESLQIAIDRSKVRSGATLFKDVPGSEIDVSIQKVTQVLKEAKPIRKEQEVLYRQERGARLGKLQKIQETTKGEAGFHAELGQLKGELPKLEFKSIRGRLREADITNLFEKVKRAPMLTTWETLSARTGLSKIFGEYGGRVPTPGELMLLDQVFPGDFMGALMGKRPLKAKLLDAGLQIANIPRAIMASFDLSFGGRQGAFAAPRFRRSFWNAWKKQFKVFGSEEAYHASREVLTHHPRFALAKNSGVDFTDIGRIMKFREEKFASQWAEKIPLVGRGIKASNRAYTSFANRYRLDIFDDLIRGFEKQGINPLNNTYLLRKTAEFVNNATGRGSLGVLENAALALNAVFFSPRLNMARMRTLSPAYYIFLPKHLRKQAILTAFESAGTATTILTIAKLGGAEVTADPRSADFGKIKIGNTRIDMLAGYGQFIRGGAQLVTGQYVSSRTGRVVKMGKGYKPLTRMDLVIRQIESKEGPIASFATGWLRGKNWTGEDFSTFKEIGNRFIPMVISDVADLYKDDPSLLPLATFGFFGIGLQTYKPKSRRPEGR